MKFAESKSVVLIVAIGTSLTACGGGVRFGSAPVEVADVVQPAIVDEAAPRPETIRLLNEISALQGEIRQLRNMIEEQQFDVENIKQRQQDLYQGLDQRLRVTETRQYASTSYDTGAATVGVKSPTGFVVENIEEPLDTASQVTVGGNEVVVDSSSSQTATIVESGDEQALYDQGFNYLKGSSYNDAIVVFKQLIRQYPDGGLADDASYWIGEANYVNRQYAQAISAFQSVVAQYPSSDRVPEALLKVGYVQYDIGDYETAKSTFEDVKRRYPNHPVANSAESRILRIQRGLTN